MASWYRFHVALIDLGRWGGTSAAAMTLPVILPGRNGTAGPAGMLALLMMAHSPYCRILAIGIPAALLSNSE